MPSTQPARRTPAYRVTEDNAGYVTLELLSPEALDEFDCFGDEAPVYVYCVRGSTVMRVTDSGDLAFVGVGLYGGGNSLLARGRPLIAVIRGEMRARMAAHRRNAAEG